MKPLACILSLLVALLPSQAAGKPPDKRHRAPASQSGVQSAAQLSVVDPIIQEAIRDHKIPGAVLLVGHGGKVVYRKAYGARALEPRREAMTADTIFDLASLTKVVECLYNGDDKTLKRGRAERTR